MAKKRVSKKKPVKKATKKKPVKKLVKKKVSKKKLIKNKPSKKKISKKPVKKKAVKKKPIKKHIKKPKKKLNFLTATSFTLSVISLLVLMSYVVAAWMSMYTDGGLLIFTYLAALVVFIIALLGVGLSTAQLAKHPSDELTKKALWLNLTIMVVTFVIFLFKVL